MKLLRGCLPVALVGLVGLVNGAETAHALRQTKGGLMFHYGVIPAEVVLERLDGAEHAPQAPGDRHLIVAVFDGDTKTRLADAEVTVTVQPGKGRAVTRRLDPMKVANQPSYGASSRCRRRASTKFGSRRDGRGRRPSSPTSSNTASRPRDADAEGKHENPPDRR